MLMLAAGRLFPRGDRSPAIVPAAPAQLHALMPRHASLAGWAPERDARVSSGFYKSHAMEWRRA
jgi:magnesium-protoporphyrin O-methyltransferase